MGLGADQRSLSLLVCKEVWIVAVDSPRDTGAGVLELRAADCGVVLSTRFKKPVIRWSEMWKKQETEL